MIGQFLSLSMFIMLLAFFIILNSMSSFEKNIAASVMNSINVAFSEAEATPDVDTNVTPDVVESYNEGHVLDRLQNLFSSQITGAKVRKNRLGTMMYVQMTVSEFEAQINNQPDSVGENSVDLKVALVSLLANNERSIYKVDVLLNLPQAPAELSSVQPDFMREQARRVASYAGILEEAGLDKRYVTAGMKVGEDDTVTLFFKPYVPFNPVTGGVSDDGGANG